MVELTVPGMSCDPCARAVTKAVRSVDPQAGVEIDLGTKRVAINSDAGFDRIRAAIETAGYEVDNPPA